MTPLRAKLWNPPNAVPDTGINMRNGHPVLKIVRPYQPSRWKTPTLTLVWEVTPYEPPPPREPDLCLLKPPGYRDPRATAILVVNETCEVWGIEQYRLIGDRRFAELVRIRWTAMAIIRRITPLSFPRIAKYLGRSDHSTIFHGCQQMAHHITALNQELSDWSTPAEWVRALKARIEA